MTIDKGIIPTGNRDRAINGRVIKVTRTDSRTDAQNEITISSTPNNRRGRRSKKNTI